METLTCTKCKETKNVVEFYICTGRKSGHQAWCKACTRDAYLLRKHKETNTRYLRRYKITIEELTALQEKQASRCKICGDVADLCVDHDHASGKVRGLLCGPCNLGLGQFRDDLNVLKAAVFYLEANV